MLYKFLIFSFVLAIVAGANELVKYSLNNNEDVYESSFKEFSCTDISVNGEILKRINLNDLPLSNIKGEPALPIKTLSIAITKNDDYHIEIMDVKAKELFVGNVLSSKGKIYRNEDPRDVPYTFGPIYSLNDFYPSKMVEIVETYMIRDQRGATIRINPIQYNPKTGIVKYIEKIKFKVISEGSGGERISMKEKSDAYTKVFRNHFLNYPKKNRYTPVSEGDKMIIITTSKYKGEVEKLALWKNKSGIKTDIYEYPTDFSGEGSVNVKKLIQEKYDAERFAYILIVGDFSDVPSPEFTQGSLVTGSDPTYTFLSGDDKKPDAFIGRFSVETLEEAKTVITKNLNYECKPRNMGTDDTNWFTSFLGISSDDGFEISGVVDTVWMNSFNDTLLSYTYKTYDKVYDPGATASMVTDAVNKGKSWINYMGHGLEELWGTSSFNNSDVNNLNNSGKLPIIISVACVNGEFKNNTCFAEAWQRCGTPTDSKGSIVFVGSSIFQDWIPPQHSNREMLHLLKKEDYLSIGAIVNNGQLKMLEVTNSQETFDTWHIFGDPSLQVITDVPSELTVAHNNNIELGQQDISIKVSGTNEGKVCLYSKKQNIQIVKNIASEVSIPVNVTTNDTIYVTVTARNRIPYQGIIIPNGETAIKGQTSINYKPVKMKIHDNKISLLINNEGKSNIKIFNLSGKKIYQSVINGKGKWHSINLPQVKGVYFLSVKNGNKTLMNKKLMFKN